MVDKDRIKGSTEQAKGKVKEVAGKLTGDRKLQSEGKATRSRVRSETPLAASKTRFGASDRRRLGDRGLFLWLIGIPCRASCSFGCLGGLH